MFSRTTALLVTVLGLTLALPAVAQWKWRDGSGKTQYSDLPPPPGVAEQDILQRPRKAASPAAPGSAPTVAAVASPASAVRAVEPELEAKRKKAEQDEALKKKAEDARQGAANAEACSRTQANLRTLESGGRLTRANSKGEIEYIDDATRIAESRRLRDIIATSCK